MTDAERERALADATATLTPRQRLIQDHHQEATQATLAEIDALGHKLTSQQREIADRLARGQRKSHIAREMQVPAPNVSRTLRLAHVRAYMAALAGAAAAPVARRMQDVILHKRWWLRRLMRHADADLGKHLLPGRNGQGFAINADLKAHGFRLDPQHTRSVRGVEIIEDELRGPGEERTLVKRRIKLRVGADPAAVQAISTMADMMGWRQGGAEREGQTQAVAVQVNVLVGQAAPGALGGALDVLLGGRGE